MHREVGGLSSSIKSSTKNLGLILVLNIMVSIFLPLLESTVANRQESGERVEDD